MAVKAAAEEQKAAVSKLVAAKSMPEALKAALADPPVQTKDLEIKVRWRSGALRWRAEGMIPRRMTPRTQTRVVWPGAGGIDRSGGHQLVKGRRGAPSTDTQLTAI
jgi:hypothetical protein